MSLVSVDFPPPEGPIKATFSLGFSLNENF